VVLTGECKLNLSGEFNPSGKEGMDGLSFVKSAYRICEHKEKKTPRSVRARQQLSDGNKVFTIPSDTEIVPCFTDNELFASQIQTTVFATRTSDVGMWPPRHVCVARINKVIRAHNGGFGLISYFLRFFKVCIFADENDACMLDH
jgi:hypothetical protein